MVPKPQEESPGGALSLLSAIQVSFGFLVSFATVENAGFADNSRRSQYRERVAACQLRRLSLH